MSVNAWRTARFVICRNGTIEVPPQARGPLGLDAEGELQVGDVLPELIGREDELTALRAGGSEAVEVHCAERNTPGMGRNFFDIRVTAGPRRGELEVELIDISQLAINLECRSQAYLDLVQNQTRLEQEIAELRAKGQVLEVAALADSLTALPNRRAAQERIRIAVEGAQRGWSGCLLFVDLDRFKAFNDRYGHPAGDRRLVLLAKALRMGLRPMDFVARWGGEEFVILLSRIEQERALQVALRLRRTVSLVLGRDSTELGYDRTVGSTISVGLCALEPGMTSAQALSRADKALYAAKDRGRNRIELALPEVAD